MADRRRGADLKADSRSALDLYHGREKRDCVPRRGERVRWPDRRQSKNLIVLEQHYKNQARCLALPRVGATLKLLSKRRRRRTILAFLILGAGLASTLAPQVSRAGEKGDCGYLGVSVIYSGTAELHAACSALADTVAYFGRIGFEITPRVLIRFTDRRAGHVSDQYHVLSFFDAARSQIVIYRNPDKNPWGLPWTPQMVSSFLGHELAHMAILQALGGDAKRLRREWHEFIAYAVQLDLTQPQLREDILAVQAQVRRFGNLSEINEFTLRMGPDVFAVAAYKTYRAEGSEKFVGQLLRGEIIPPRFSYPFPVLPEPPPRQED